MVQDEPFYNKILSVWGGELEGLDLTSARFKSYGRVRYKPSSEGRALSKQVIGKLVYAEVEDADFSGTLSMTAEEDSICHGVCLWFEMFLTEDLRILTDPWLHDNIEKSAYGSAFIPWLNPVSLKQGCRYSVDVFVNAKGKDCALGLNEDGTATLFLGRLTERKTLLEEKYLDVELKNSSLAMLSPDGKLFPYRVGLRSQKGETQGLILVRETVFLGEEQPRKAQAVVLLLGKCLNVKSLSNPLDFFELLVS